MHHSVWLYTLCSFFPSFTKMGPYCSHGHWWRTAIILYLIISAALICTYVYGLIDTYVHAIYRLLHTIWQNIATSAHALTWSLYCSVFFVIIWQPGLHHKKVTIHNMLQKYAMSKPKLNKFWLWNLLTHWIRLSAQKNLFGTQN